MLLENKNAIIYGAGGAVGGAVAHAFAREGATVFLTGRTRAKVEAVAKEIAAAGGAAATAAVDALDEEAVEAHARTVAEKAGRVDIAFNAVGLDRFALGTPIVEMTAEAFLDPVALMVRTQFVTAKAVARHMARQGSGVILTMTSLHARQAIPFFGSTGVVQAAIEGLFRQLAGELGPQGIRVVCLCSSGSPDAPGMDAVGDTIAAASGMTREELETSSREAVPLRRFPLLAEIGNVAALMASDHASPMTGAVANVTCGALVD